MNRNEDFGRDILNWLSRYIGDAPKAYFQQHGRQTRLRVEVKSQRIVRNDETGEVTAHATVALTVKRPRA